MAKRGLEYVLSRERRVLLDVPVGAALLGATALGAIPLGAVASYATRSTPFFRQRRAWRPDRPVDVVKFRTIPPHPPDKLQLQGTRDSRASASGLWLRESGLDELPQAVNILGGSMSAVGPRPMLQDTLDYMSNEGALFDEWLELYQTIRPGEFGPSQLYRRGHEADVSSSALRDSMTIDLRYYTERATLASDWELVMRTGAYLTHLGSASPDEIVHHVMGDPPEPPPSPPA